MKIRIFFKKGDLSQVLEHYVEIKITIFDCMLYSIFFLKQNFLTNVSYSERV